MMKITSKFSPAYFLTQTRSEDAVGTGGILIAFFSGAEVREGSKRKKDSSKTEKGDQKKI